VEERYQASLQAAVTQGSGAIFLDFEASVRASRAVIARPLRDVDRVTSSDRELFSTFYGLTQGEVRLPFGDKWDRLRGMADETLFPGYRQHIRFAALSLDGIGLSSFGECSMTLRPDMIAHRATVFEDNSAAIMEKHRYQEPPGFRATWQERSRLCAAKCGIQIGPETSVSEFPQLLLQEGSNPGEQRFVEVHIWGAMTIHAVERVIVSRRNGEVDSAFRMALQDRLRSAWNLDMEES
jgi:hypothetical protein